MHNLSSHMPSKSIWIAMLAAATAATAIAALGLSSNSRAGHAQPEAQVADANLVANLSVLRRPATSADALPARLDRDLAVALGAGAAPEGVLARRALVSSSGVSVYLVPANNGEVCLTDTDMSESFCASVSAVLAGKATASVSCSPRVAGDQIEIAGILPDGVSNPTLLLSNGQSLPLQETGNAYLERFARSGALPRTIRWTDSSGDAQSVDTAVPADAASLDCKPAPVESGAQTPNGSVAVEYNRG